MDSQANLTGPDNVREIQEKAPSWKADRTICHHSAREVPVKEHYPVICEDLNGSFIRSTALRTSGAAGLSGMDSSAWIGMCSSFHNASSELCTAMALVGKLYAPYMLTPWASE